MVLNANIASTPGIGEKQVATEWAHNPEVAGSNPAPATILFRRISPEIYPKPSAFPYQQSYANLGDFKHF
jgi:hypothetical protein